MDKIIRKDFGVTISKSDGRDVVVVSTDAKDRTGDVLRQDGWVLDNFIANPQMFYGHDSYSRFPVGNWKNIHYQDGKLAMEPVFADGVEGHTDAKIVKGLWDAGFLRTVSVGFQPLEWKDSDTGTDYTRMELLEVSVVPIPANPEAHRLALKSMENVMERLEALERRLAEPPQEPTPETVKAGGDEPQADPEPGGPYIYIIKE